MSTYSTSSIPQGIQIYANATLFPVTAQDGEQAVAADTNTLYIYDTSIPGWQAVANPGAAIAIDALTGDVTATGPGVVAATIANAAVTNAKLAAMADNTVKGNKSGAPASPSDLTLSNLTESTSNVLTITNGSKAIVATSDLTIQVKQSGAAQDGYLSSSDWSSFNAKLVSINGDTTPAQTISAGTGISVGTAAGVTTVTNTAPMAATGNLTEATSSVLTISGGTGAVIGAGGTTIQVLQSGAAQSGYLSSGDWSTFNSKVSSVSGSAPISSSGGTTPTISITQSGAATNGYLSSTDWNTFNNAASSVAAATALSTPSTLMARDASGETALDGLSLDGSTSGSIKLQAAATTTSYTVKMPSAQGAASTFLQNDGSGNLSWNTVTVLPSQTSNADKVLATDGTSASWQFAGLGSGSFGTNNVIVGRAKPTWTGLNSIIIGTTATANGGDTELVTVGIGSSAGIYSVAVGHNASAQATGTGNGQCVAIGKSANCTGPDSVTVGYIAAANGGGVAIGRDATVTNSGGGVAIGRASATSATGYNTHGIAIGYSAKAGSGNSTIVIGQASGNQGATSTGAANTIVGSASVTALTSGANNVVVGQNSAILLSTGSENVCVGYTAATTNIRNGVSTHSQNVFVGSRSGFANIGGTGAVAVGYGAGAEANAVAVGSNAYAGNTSIAIGTSAYTGLNSASVAIGYSSLTGLGFGANGGSQTTTLGAYTGGGSLTGGFGLLTRCVYLGAYAGSYSTGKTDEFMLDNQSRGSYANTQTNSLLYGTFNATPASQTLTVNAALTSTYGFVANEIGGNYDTRIEGDNDANLVFVDASTDKVGIGTATPAEKLEVNGNVLASELAVANYKVSPKHHDEGTETGNFTINWANSPVQTVTINAVGPLVATFSNPVQGGAYALRVIQGATPGTITWPTNVKWPTNGTGPTLSTSTGEVDIVNFLYIDDGGGNTYYYGTFATDFA